VRMDRAIAEDGIARIQRDADICRGAGVWTRTRCEPACAGTSVSTQMPLPRSRIGTRFRCPVPIPVATEIPPSGMRNSTADIEQSANPSGSGRLADPSRAQMMMVMTGPAAGSPQRNGAMASKPTAS
jgi:hypothetical protein